MREIGLSGSSVGHRNCVAEDTGERGQGEAGGAELSAGLPAAGQPLLPVLKKQGAAAGGKQGEDEQCFAVKL